MVKCSNSLIGILNFVTLVLSIPIIVAGVWLSKQSNTECERWLEKPVIALGVFLLIISILGLVGACCRVTWLLWVYLLVMFVLIVILFGFTIFAFVVTNKGAGEAVSGKGYKEYRLGDYSNWLQNRVNGSTWERIKSCLQSGKLCSKFENQFINDNVDKFYTENLSSLQSGCCKPSNDCGFIYKSPTSWTKTGNVTHTNPDCDSWNNDPNILCYNCQSCKAGLLQNIKSDWKKVAVVNIIFLVFLIIVYSIGCCAFRNNRMDNYYKGY
ncbi:putative tetraspanin/Peripherin [Lupinus albus]|uniref:Putative tetraspanin/Peripherin n=1 Tax=Lupinus albus TaxID=3870 RepID=A0A6A4PLH0_LUPAL|nr:putative tetraspanin/Peripherin [Lupinus albus]